ncbi:MAG TPA: EscU/YscU/HrcU family type III secretion system export apparatus switch protein [Ideonella sp.]|nr:EscU/YscU/HrcU family type III secretion system export apparatus switch protein [Ideonella sp.]
MADKNDGGDKTEKPTPKRLKDARKKGDVPKSREVTSTAGLLAWLVLGALLLGTATERIAALWERLFAVLAQGWSSQAFGSVAASLGWQAAELTMWLVALLLLPAAAVGLLVEYLQAGPVLAFEKLSPKLEHLNPAEGVKRMFSMDNLVELAKGIGKTALLFVIGTLVALAMLPQILLLARSDQVPAQALGRLIWDGTVQVVAWTVGVFTLVSLLDAVWQRHSFTRKLRMSLRDIRQEMKESEGDPYIKQQRKQAHAEWSQRNAAGAARGANALIVNPTHVAIAIDYDRERSPVPTVSAKGEDHVARAMREAAEEAGVPIVRNVPLARDLLARAEVGEVVPPDLFDAIAEVVLWAREVREQMAWQTGDPSSQQAEPPRRRVPAPGEDLSHYPQQPAAAAGRITFD